MGIFALLSFLPTEEQGREGRLAGGGLGWRLGARGRLWSEGKERGRREDPIPGRGSVGGGSWELGHDGRRRLWWHLCEVRRRSGSGAKARGDPGGSIPPLTLGWDGARGRRDGGLRRRALELGVAVLRS